MHTRVRIFFPLEIVNYAALVIAISFCLTYCPTASGDRKFFDNTRETSDKLLIIMLDGFKWDYYEEHKDSLNGFQKFLSEGVQAEWVETIFPAVSYAAWTTISTGVFPETHGILGNYMFDPNATDPSKSLFILGNRNTTMRPEWWQNSEPIWTTATKHNKKTFLRYWSRCDVPFKGISPHECTGYQSAGGVENIRRTFNIAVQKLKEDFELVMVYGEHIDNVGHRYGPHSPEIKEALVGVDGALQELLNKLNETQLDNKVNIIIVSDHGMTWTAKGSGVTYVNMNDYLDVNEIHRSVERGPYMSISPLPQHYNKVLERLKSVPGVDVYERKDIPEEYHYKNSRLALEILVVSKNKYSIRGLQTDKQIPKDRSVTGYATGVHGYADMVDMRTIFYAKGPAFKKGIIHPPIKLEDEYQIFAKLLNIPAQPHNGSWSRVVNMMHSGAVSQISPVSLQTLLPFTLPFAANRIVVN